MLDPQLRIKELETEVRKLKEVRASLSLATALLNEGYDYFIQPGEQPLTKDHWINLRLKQGLKTLGIKK